MRNEAEEKSSLSVAGLGLHQSTNEIENTGYEPVAVDASIHKWIRIGGISTFLVLGSMVAWGSTAPLSGAVVTQGRVTVESNSKEIAHLEGGIVRRLKVRDGSRVTKGEVLFSIDETRALASVLTTKSALNAKLAREARLMAEIDNKKIDFPRTLVKQDTDTSVQAMIKLETDLFATRAKARTGETSILKRQRDQLKSQLANVQSQLKATTQRHVIIKKELEGLSGLLKRGLVGRQRFMALQREERNLAGQVGGLKADATRISQAVLENELQTDQVQKEFDRAVVNELSEVRTQIIDLRQKLLASNDVLNRSQVRAPVSGTVVSLQVHGEGAVVGPGETVLEIVPNKDRMKIEVKVLPQDIDNVTLDQDAQIRLSGFKQRTTPPLNGNVSYISADIIEERGQDTPHYLVRVDVSAEELKKLGDQRLQPGMPAEVFVKTRSRTAIQYLATPILDSIGRAWRED